MDKEKKYKKIEIPMGRKLYPKESYIIADMMREFIRSDFYFEIQDNEKMNFYLRAIDLEKFRNFIGNAIKKYNLDDRYSKSKANIFFKIIESIEEIRSYGIKGKKRIYIGYDRERKVKDREHKELRRGFHFYANGCNFSKKNNELAEEFINKIICEDSECILKQLPKNSIDLIFTSPPYNFGLEYDASEDGVNWEKYFHKLFRIFSECIRVLKYGGRIIINIQPLFSDYIPSHHIINNFFIKNKLIWKGEILWEKHNYNCKYTAWGSWKSPSSPYLKYTWEFLEVFAKGTLKKTGLKENIDITSEEFKNWVVAKWSIAPERNMEKYGHPAMFPEELAYRVIKLFSYKTDIVLDPFNGVGTTTVVAKKLDRRFLGIDVSQQYCDKAIERLNEILL